MAPTPEVTTQPNTQPRFRRSTTAAALLLSGSLMIVGCGNDNETQAADPTTSSIEAATTTTPEICVESWEMPGVDHGDNNRWFSDGLHVIRESQNQVQAREAANEWIHGIAEGDNAHPGIKHDAELFAASYNAIFINADKQINSADLIDAEGCATPAATAALAELDLALAESDIEPSVAPADAVNTGTDENGNVTVASESGVYGDDESRKAISITTKDGCTIYVMARCGQIVVFKDCVPPSIPEGPTEVPPKHDDGELPGDGTDASQDGGTPDRPGEGPAGQEPGDDGYLPQEPRPTYPTTTTRPNTPTTSGGVTPTTGVQPTAPSAPPTTGSVPPNNSTMPPVPQV